MPLEKFAYVIPDFLAGSKFPDTATDVKIFTEIVAQRKIKTLISLTETSHPHAKKFVEEFGLQRYEHLPISDFSVPSEAQIRKFIGIVFETTKDEKKEGTSFNFINAPILTHCHLGAGRTGLLLSIGIIAYFYFCIATKNLEDPIFKFLSQTVNPETKQPTNLLMNLMTYHRKVRPQSILTTKQVRFLEGLLLDLPEEKRRDLFTPPCSVGAKL